jgi:transcriptional regulator with XRE-family HTH domain
MTNIGIKIKERREELGMSQDELALKMGYKSRSTIAKIEKGVNDVVQSNIVKFAEVLYTTPAYLMGWMEEVENNPIEAANELSEIFLDTELREMIAEYKKLDNEKKKQVREFIRFLGGRN